MTELLIATDADYNASTRNTELKAELYLYGAYREPLVINRDNFLVDFSLLEETNSEDKSPFGNVTANEITLKLMNTNGIFSQTNTESPYYGYMKQGVEVRIFIRPANKGNLEYKWDELGKFYVTDWDATLTSLTANITAADKIYKVFETPAVKLPMLRDILFSDFFVRIFNALGVPVTIDASIVRMLKIAYSTDQNKDLLTKASIGALANCFCDHMGEVVVKSITAPRPLRATLTDNDQVKDAGSSQGSDTSYTGTAVTYNVPSESEPIELLSIPSFVVPAGTTIHNPISLSDTPMVRLVYAGLKGTSDAYVENIQGTNSDVIITTRSESTDASEMGLSVFGTKLINTETSLADNSASDLSINNMYIQSAEYADYYKSVLQRYIANDTPVIVVQVRGNPLLNLGDKLRIVSEKYKLDFTGILLRHQLTYNGALSGTITLLSTDILEG